MRAKYTPAPLLGRLARPAEVTRTILFFAGDDSAFTTAAESVAAELVVDGGLTAA
jgi:hypothetical protein